MFALLDELLRRPPVIIESDDPFSGTAQVGDDEADAGVQFTTGDSASITAGVVAAAPKGYQGATMAVHSCIGFIGAFAGPLMFGVMLDFTSPTGVGGETIASWGWAFAFTSLIVTLGPLALALLREKKKD